MDLYREIALLASECPLSVMLIFRLAVLLLLLLLCLLMGQLLVSEAPLLFLGPI